MTIGETIKELRINQGLSLKEIEDKCGVTASYIWRLEKGEKQQPTVKILGKLAKAYGITPVALFNIFLEPITTTGEDELSLTNVLINANIVEEHCKMSTNVKLLLVNLIDNIRETKSSRETDVLLLNLIDVIRENYNK